MSSILSPCVGQNGISRVSNDIAFRIIVDVIATFPFRIPTLGNIKLIINNYDDDDKKKLIRQTIAFQRSYVVSVIRFSRLEIIVAIKKLSRNY